jgi:hypothetical protein
MWQLLLQAGDAAAAPGAREFGRVVAALIIGYMVYRTYKHFRRK